MGWKSCGRSDLSTGGIFMGLPSQRIARLIWLVFMAAASFIFSPAADAQVPTSGNVFFGYSYVNTTPFFLGVRRASLNGWEASLEGKVLPWVGMVADFSGHYGSQTFPGSCPPGFAQCPASVNFNEQNILFGPRVSISAGKIRPFAEALFGASHIGSDGAGSDTSFATALGGGLDYKIVRLIALRVQGDYVQTRFFGTTQNNVRLSTGIVVRF
jgi:opacity protein-like surface antigen